jgi:hypothetical protein
MAVSGQLEAMAVLLVGNETQVASGKENGWTPDSVSKLPPLNYNLPVEAQRVFLLAEGILGYHYRY